VIKAASASSSTLGIKNTFRRSAQHHLLVCRFVCNSLIDYGRNGLGKGPAGKYSILATSTTAWQSRLSGGFVVSGCMPYRIAKRVQPRPRSGRQTLEHCESARRGEPPWRRIHSRHLHQFGFFLPIELLQLEGQGKLGGFKNSAN
jgi:hypothetical protein